MKQVQFFSEASEVALQREVNQFIRERQEIFLEEVDIRYNLFVEGKGLDRWTAMVIHGK